MRPSYLVAALLIVVVGAWWWLGDDPEDRVRAAHSTLEQFLNKSEDEPEGSIPVMQLRGLQGLFAQDCTVFGDAEGLVGSYSADELVGLMVRARGAFRSVALQFDEVAVEFPEEDTAITRFSAALDGVTMTGERLTETREVESRMRDIDGAWQFVSFDLEDISQTGEERR
jgi:hypothetical protein